MDTPSPKHGRLHSLEDLVRLSYDVAVRRADGTLAVAGNGKQFLAGFARGHLRSLKLPQGSDQRLGVILVNQGHIDRGRLNASLRRARSDRMLQGQVLIQWGLEPDRLWDALRTQAHRRFKRFLDEARGAYRFDPQGRLDLRHGLGAPVDLISLLRQQSRHIPTTDGRKGWRAQLSNRWVRIVDAKCPPSFCLTPEELACLDQIKTPTRLETVLTEARNQALVEDLLLFLDHVGALQWSTSRPCAGPTDDLSEPLEPPTTLVELRRWYHAAARRYHPDANPSLDPETRDSMAERFVQIKMAYERSLARLKV